MQHSSLFKEEVLMSKKMVCIDGNTAAAHVAHATNEVIAIYPITPSSVMGEVSDAKSAAGQKNIWDTIPKVVEMQSEGGAAGAVHGALQAGAMTTTFTASQGLLLMIPNMFKIAGELTPTVFHVSARAIAAQALSIFGDHSDVMSCTSTGWAFLSSNNVQEVMDFALVAQAASLESRIPFLHFFDGFRTSSEVQKVHELSENDMRHMVSDELVRAHRARALSPDHPVLRGTAQNPDVYFQGRETVNSYYDDLPGILQAQFDKFAKLTGRQYNLFDYVGHPNAERVVVMMGSACDTMHELVEYLVAQGEKVGLIKVRFFLPFNVAAFAEVLPNTVRKIAVLDRTKEPGSIGEPLYHNVRTAFGEAMADGLISFPGYPSIVGGRYGLGSYEFSPGMAKAVFDNLSKDKPMNHYVVGIKDDVTGRSLDFDADYIVPFDGYSAMFYGLGSDGTVGANKNSIKIIGDTTENYVQGYFVYDSKKAGAQTISHLRFGPEPIYSSYLIDKADFIASHQFNFIERYDMIADLKQGGTFLLNSPFSKEEIWDKLPKKMQEGIIEKEAKFYVVDATEVAHEANLGKRTNTVLQTCFFAISGILPKDEAIQKIKDATVKSYAHKGDAVVEMNFNAVDKSLENLYQVDYPKKVSSEKGLLSAMTDAPDGFVKEVLEKILG